MVLYGVEVIRSQLDNICLDSFNNQANMHPLNEKTACDKNQLPRLHVTPSSINQKKDGNSSSGASNPCLLKPQHDIPPTPPPQVETKSENLFLQRNG